MAAAAHAARAARIACTQTAAALGGPAPRAGLRMLPRMPLRWRGLSSPTAAAAGTVGQGGGMSGRQMLGMALFGGMSAGTFALGCWQTYRYTWKQEVIARKTAMLAEEPVTLEHVPQLETLTQEDVLKQFDGRRVQLRGFFDHSREVFVGLRPAPADTVSQSAQGMATNPQGYYVYTPFRSVDGKTTSIVNRGWVSRNMTEWTQPEGEVSLVGVFVQPEAEATFTPESRTAAGTLLWPDTEQMVQMQGLDKSKPIFVLDQVAPDDEKAIVYPVCKRERHLIRFFVTPAVHVSYAVTWFALSLVAAFVGRRVVLGRSFAIRPRRPPPKPAA